MCVAGARAAHDQILAQNQSPNLKVYAIWLRYYPWDSRSDIDPAILRDSRVTQFWDPDRLAAHWFADNVDKDPGGTAWDVYFLYGPQSRWDAAPPSGLVASGSPVVGDLDNLRSRLSTT